MKPPPPTFSIQKDNSSMYNVNNATTEKSHLVVRLFFITCCILIMIKSTGDIHT